MEIHSWCPDPFLLLVWNFQNKQGPGGRKMLSYWVLGSSCNMGNCSVSQHGNLSGCSSQAPRPVAEVCRSWNMPVALTWSHFFPFRLGSHSSNVNKNSKGRGLPSFPMVGICHRDLPSALVLISHQDIVHISCHLPPGLI